MPAQPELGALVLRVSRVPPVLALHRQLDRGPSPRAARGYPGRARAHDRGEAFGGGGLTDFATERAEAIARRERVKAEQLLNVRARVCRQSMTGDEGHLNGGNPIPRSIEE